MAEARGEHLQRHCRPRFHESDIERFRDTFDNILSEQRWQNPVRTARTALRRLRSTRSPLGTPAMCCPRPTTPAAAEAHGAVLKYVVPSRTVIAGVNVDHNALVSAYENSPYPHSDTAPHHAKTAAERKTVDIYTEEKQYTGGEFHEQENRAKEMGTKPDMEYETIAAVGFKSFGRDVTAKDYAAALVTRHLFDIATNDGSRYDRVETHHGVRSFYRSLRRHRSDGFTARTGPKEINKVVLDTLKVFQGVNTDNLATAKRPRGGRLLQLGGRVHSRLLQLLSHELHQGHVALDAGGGAGGH